MDTDSNPPCSVPRTVRKTLCQARSSGDARQLATQCSDGKDTSSAASASPCWSNTIKHILCLETARVSLVLGHVSIVLLVSLLVQQKD